MPHLFDWLCKDVVKKLQGKDLKPVKRLSDAKKFRQFEILQKTSQSLFWKSEDTPVGYSLLQILEPNVPVPEPEVLAPISLRNSASMKLEANAGIKAVAEGSASTEFVQSGGYNIEVQCTSIENSKLESLQNRKLIDQEPSFLKDCQQEGNNLYVVTEAFEVTKDTVLEDSSSADLSGSARISQVVEGQAKGKWQRERTDSVSIPKGSVVAYKKKQLIIENNTCAIVLSGKAKKRTFSKTLPKAHREPPEVLHSFPSPPVSGRGPFKTESYLPIWIALEIEDISPIGRIEEPSHLDFKCLQDEVSEKTWNLAMLSKDVRDVVFSSLLPILGDRESLYELMTMLELNQLKHMDGPGGMILDKLRQDSGPLRRLILYLLQALMVLSDTQLNLLAQSMEKRLLLHQRELVKSILQPNFKYPWNIPFTLQPQLLAPLQDEGLAITYELLKECGLKMELNNPRSTWDLEAKMPLSALYGSLAFLQQLAEA